LGGHEEETYQKAVTEEKSGMVIMTQKEVKAKANWPNRIPIPPNVPADPGKSFILVAGCSAPLN
jgi:hypothetical protein